MANYLSYRVSSERLIAVSNSQDQVAGYERPRSFLLKIRGLRPPQRALEALVARFQENMRMEIFQGDPLALQVMTSMLK